MPTLDVSGAVLAFAGSITLKTGGVGAWVDGVFTPASPTSSTIQAMVAPLKPEELARFPEGTRVDQVIQVFTTTASLSPFREGTGAAGDSVVWRGVEYQIEQVEAWDELGGFVRALARRLDV